MMNQQPLIKNGLLRVLLFVITFVLLTGIVQIAAGKIIPASPAKAAGSVLNDQYVLISLLLSVVCAFATVYFFRTVVDKQSFASLGFRFRDNVSHAGAGLFTGLLLLGVGTLALVAGNYLQWSGISFNASDLFLCLGLMVLVAFGEEIVFRGYILSNLLPSMNKWAALAISALLFTLFHLGNPGITPVAIANIFIAGVLLGINYIYTRNLWFGICFHVSWNFYEGAVLGYKVSGLNLPTLLQQDLSGNPLFTGGRFGFEGSVLFSVLAVITAVLLAWVYEKKLEP